MKFFQFLLGVNLSQRKNNNRLSQLIWRWWMPEYIAKILKGPYHLVLVLSWQTKKLHIYKKERLWYLLIIKILSNYCFSYWQWDRVFPDATPDDKKSQIATSRQTRFVPRLCHRGAFCQFPFRLIYYYGSNKSTGKKTGRTHLCALV